MDKNARDNGRRGHHGSARDCPRSGPVQQMGAVLQHVQPPQAAGRRGAHCVLFRVVARSQSVSTVLCISHQK